MTEYSVLPLSLTEKDAFTEASQEELRVLLVLIERGGAIEDTAALATVARISNARAKAALIFWEEAGVIRPISGESSEKERTVTEEFEERLALGKITERSAGTVAREIRDNNLADLLSECARMMQKPALGTEEVKIISALYTQYALNEEYIVTLAAYLSDKGKLTAQRLGAEAERLIKRGIDCTEALVVHLEEKENEVGAEWEFKRTIGIYNRNLSKKEKEIVKRWYNDFAFDNAIIEEAYSINSRLYPNKVSYPYMDKILTHWHDEGCKTLEECKALSERERAALDAGKETANPPSIPRKKPTPRYGDFDINDAFEKALLRSYGEGGEKKN